MRARQQIDPRINPDEYGKQGHLFGGVPINIVAVDFLQIKPMNDLSVADDFSVFDGTRRHVHPEHHTAQEAILGITDVIHLTKSKRFLDEALPAVMEAVRGSRPDAPLAEEELEKLRGRKIENCLEELQTPLFADGHVVSIYWETYHGASWRGHIVMPGNWKWHCTAYKPLTTEERSKTKSMTT